MSSPTTLASAPSARRFHLLLLTALVALFAVHALRFFHHIVDDSYMYYRFAENFVRGYGFVFSPGERVEGHSSTLWVVWLGLLGKLGLPIPETARVTGIAVAALTVFFSWHLARRFPIGPGLALVVPALLALSVSWAYWSASGMPEVLLAFLLVASTLAYLRELEQPRRFPWSALWLVLVALTRSESFALPALFVVHSLLYGWCHDRLVAHRRQILWRALLAGAGVAALLAWRYGYYGWLLSNVSYAKLAGSGGATSAYSISQYRFGFEYFLGFLRGHTLLTGAALATVPFWWALRRHPLLWLSLFLCGFQLLLMLKSGGDWMPLWRFTIPALPFVFALCAGGAGVLAGRWPRWAWVPGAALVLAGAASNFKIQQTSRPRLETMKLTWNSVVETAEQLRGIVPRGELIASCAVGIIPYVMIDYPWLDMVGLCDVHIAHHGRRANVQLGAPDDYWEKADMDYVFLERKPPWVLINRAPYASEGEGGPRNDERVLGADGREWSTSRTSGTNQLAARHPAFLAEYELVAELQNQPLPDDPQLGRTSRRMFVYKRK